MPGAYWSVDIYIYISTISMSHDLRVSLLAAIICNLVFRIFFIFNVESHIATKEFMISCILIQM